MEIFSFFCWRLFVASLIFDRHSRVPWCARRGTRGHLCGSSSSRQIAALGATVAIVVGMDPHGSRFRTGFSLGFTFSSARQSLPLRGPAAGTFRRKLLSG